MSLKVIFTPIKLCPTCTSQSLKWATPSRTSISVNETTTKLLYIDKYHFILNPIKNYNRNFNRNLLKISNIISNFLLNYDIFSLLNLIL